MLLTSESVTEGHPDKVCDQISDAVLDASLARTPTARVACEACVKSTENRHWAAVFGEVTPAISSDEVRGIVRDTFRRIGYTDPAYGASADDVEIEVVLSTQSEDIAQGVDHALEVREGTDQDVFDTGAGDQGMMFGFACDETPDLMPLPIWLAHRLSQRLTQVRRLGELGYLRPDGKTQVSVVYEGGRPVSIDTVLISTQHQPGIDIQTLLAPDLVQHVIGPLLPKDLDTDDVSILINPTGRFEQGGPHADTGLTGRKIIVDTYGGMARHGGGAFSGKDPSKVDRSAAYLEEPVHEKKHCQ